VVVPITGQTWAEAAMALVWWCFRCGVVRCDVHSIGGCVCVSVVIERVQWLEGQVIRTK